MRKILAVIALALASGVGMADLDADQQPYCPTEDSCRPTYDGETNTWTIVEAMP